MTPIAVLSLCVVTLMPWVAMTTKIERRSSYQQIHFAGEHIHIGDLDSKSGVSKQHRRQQQWRPIIHKFASVSDPADVAVTDSPTTAVASHQSPRAANCPVEPPCFCTNGRVGASAFNVPLSRPTGNSSTLRGAKIGNTGQHSAAVISQRITCGVFGMTSASRGSRRNNKKKKSRRKETVVRSSRRFPRFVESNDAIERHVSLSYSGLTTIPGAAFHALKVRDSSVFTAVCSRPSSSFQFY